jgi:glycine cleavage system aminomethyltransferase T
VHRKFGGFIADGGQPIAAGTKIVSGEKEVGEITSAVVLRQAQAQKNAALGYIRREVGTPGREVMVGYVKATVVSLPIPDSVLWADTADTVANPA